MKANPEAPEPLCTLAYLLLKFSAYASFSPRTTPKAEEKYELRSKEMEEVARRALSVAPNDPRALATMGFALMRDTGAASNRNEGCLLTERAFALSPTLAAEIRSITLEHSAGYPRANEAVKGFEGARDELGAAAEAAGPSSTVRDFFCGRLRLSFLWLTAADPR